MKPAADLVVLVFLLAGGTPEAVESDIPAGAQAPVVSRIEAVPDDFGQLRFRVQVGNRLYPGWSEEHDVSVGDEIFLGDTEYTAIARTFFADFKIKDGVPFDASTDWNNPALKMVVVRDSASVDSTWAFHNLPPHFAPTSFFTFMLVEVITPPSEDAPPVEGKGGS